ncbi:MAG: MBL fold metallo-hydrolase [Chthoniobacteraceae bacterium]|nr:MBL fold metallo-hydrolase [Chthoniobacteraceae bacterium]
MSSFRFTNLTRQIEIGANCYLLEIAGRRIVLDCGAHPKAEGRESLPLLEHLSNTELDAVILTHAHQDHLGSLPVLMKAHPKVNAFMTEPTRQLADAMLHNSVNVMMKRQESGEGQTPLFTHKDATACTRRFQSLPTGKRFSLNGDRLGYDEATDVSLQLEDAGHILGSSAVLLEAEGRRILYTGDVNFLDQTLMQGARLPDKNIDTVIVECTRGATPQPEGFTREQEELRFAEAIRKVFAQGGSVLVPVFALGKSQELLTMIHKLRQKQLLPHCPIYIGGLSTKLTEIHDRLANASSRQHVGLDLLETVAPFTISGREINNLPIRPGRIYALSSGMMTENTLSNVIVSQFLPNPAHGIFFVGYADPESPAGRLRSATHGEPIQLGASAPSEVLRCKVDTFGFSAHSDRDSIAAYLEHTAPRHIIFVHGEPQAQEWFRQTLRPRLPETQMHTVAPGVPLEL